MAQNKACGPLAGDGIALTGGGIDYRGDATGGADNGAGKRNGEESVFQSRLIN